MKNILYNTTRQWNCGDEFIMEGVKNLITQLCPDHNPVIFDRNPDLGFLESSGSNKRLSNSWSLQDFKFDYYIVAGSPEWGGPRNSGVTNFICKNNIPSFFMGIGTKANIKLVKNLLQNSPVIICRDNLALSQTREINKNAVSLHCPALFCTDSVKKDSLNHIGIVFQSDKVRWHSITSEEKSSLIHLIKELSSSYKVSLVCHYHKELYEARKLFSDLDIYYSYDSKDYFQIYKKFDLTISTRLHGCFCSISCGVPTIMPSRSSNRCSSAIKESPLVINKDFSDINPSNVDVGSVSASIISYKKEIERKYLDILSPFFN